MEDISTQLTDLSDHRQYHHRHHYHHHHHHQSRTPMAEMGDDECSTDSGCSSGDSIRSGERLSRRGVSSEHLCRSNRSPRTHCYVERLRGRPTRSQERLSSSVQKSSERTWSSPEDVRSLPRSGISPSSYSLSTSDAHSSSDSDSLKRSSTTETLRRAFQSLKITSSKENNKEKKHTKKSPKRILRSPVPYMYVRGPSGLPTQRVPRNSNHQQQTIQPCSY